MSSTRCGSRNNSRTMCWIDTWLYTREKFNRKLGTRVDSNANTEYFYRVILLFAGDIRGADIRYDYKSRVEQMSGWYCEYPRANVRKLILPINSGTVIFFFRGDWTDLHSRARAWLAKYAAGFLREFIIPSRFPHLRCAKWRNALLRHRAK